MHTYLVGMSSFGGVVSASGSMWVGLGYSVDFDDEALINAGVSDLSFAGIAQIDPLTNAVTRHAIAGAVEPTGMKVDGSTIWVTDMFADKIFKFDIATTTVTETISLAAGSNPRNTDFDATYLYVALNKAAGGGNSEILKIEKANTANVVTIDTTAPITDYGTFTVFVVNNKLFWTDQSQHVGVIDLSTNGKMYETTATFSSSNHFGCQAG